MVATGIDSTSRAMMQDAGSVGAKAQNLWIWGPSNIGKTEGILHRIASEYAVWILEKSTNIWSPPRMIDRFALLDEAKDLTSKDIQAIKSLTDQTGAPKQIRTFCKKLLFFKTFLFLILVFLFLKRQNN